MSKRTSQSPLVGILIIALGIIGGLFFASTTETAEPVSILVKEHDKSGSRTELETFKTLRFDLSTVQSEGFTSLRVIGESPVLPGTVGRTNIFSPI